MSMELSEVEVKKALVEEEKSTSNNSVENRKILINEELKKVSAYIKTYNKEYKLYSRYNRAAKFFENRSALRQQSLF